MPFLALRTGEGGFNPQCRHRSRAAVPREPAQQNSMRAWAKPNRRHTPALRSCAQCRTHI